MAKGKKEKTSEESAMTAEEAMAQTEEEFESDESQMPTQTQMANRTIRNYMIGSIAASLVPAPAFDVAAVTAVQLKMLHSIAGIYNVPFRQEMGKSIVWSLVSSIGANSIARGTFGTLVKFIPVVGPLAGAVTLPVICGAATYAVGKIFIQHFEAGGTFLDFDPEAVRSHFRKHFREGESMAKDLKPEAEEAANGGKIVGEG
jgi:uncharacterized protein (DUF697 family)